MTNRPASRLEKRQQLRIILACIFLVTLLGVLSVRLVWIELWRGESLAERARAHYEYEEILEAPRGRIFDRNGELLASSQTVFTLVVDCAHLRDPGLASIGLARRESRNPRHLRRHYLPGELQSRYLEHVVETLSPVTRIPRPELARRLKSKDRGEIVLARNIDDDFRRELQQVLDDRAIGGIYLRKSHRRIYPSPQSLTHVIGFVAADQRGREGIEKVFDEEMRGVDGLRICDRDRRRRQIHAYRKLHVDPVPGRDVHLTIDMGLQAELERQLDELVAKYRPEKISSIWLRPATGEVLALANRPDFDLESRVGNRRNIAVTDLYQPGSTFKIVAFGGAFDQGLATPDTPVNCHQGSYELDGFAMKDHAPFGILSAEMVLAKSSNIGTFLVARPLGEAGFHQYMDRFGFGRKTGIALTAENPGAIYPVDRWSAPSFSSKTIGYEVMVTPIQMAAACNVVANDGIFQSPVLLRGFSEGDGQPLIRGAQGAGRRVISEHAARQLKRCLARVMTEGTGRQARLPGYSLAGKTGTARKHVEDVGYVEGRYVVSFVGFLPVEDPQLLGLVVIDDPQSEDLDLYGGTVAAPAFLSIAREAVRVLGIRPDRPEELTARDSSVNLISSHAP